MQFNNIIGQHDIKERLIDSVKNDRISHAQMLIGPEGNGKLALALAYARYIHCTDKGEDDACGKCDSCRKYDKLIHPDLHLVFPVVRTNKFSKPVSDNFVNQWREFVLDNPYNNLHNWLAQLGTENLQGQIFNQESYQIYKKLSLKTYEAPVKIMVIWMAEKMNHIAANKLLKLLEEPSGNTVFLLIAENTEQMLPTIISRTQLIRVPRITHDDLTQYLQTYHRLDRNKSETLAAIADGNYLKVLGILNNSEEETFNYNKFVEWMRLCYTRKIGEVMNWVDEIASVGRERQKSFILYTLRMIRENFIFGFRDEKRNIPVHLAEKERAFSQNFSPYINQNNVFDIANELETAHYHISRNAYSKLVFFDVSLKLIKLLRG